MLQMCFKHGYTMALGHICGAVIHDMIPQCISATELSHYHIRDKNC